MNVNYIGKITNLINSNKYIRVLRLHKAKANY